MRKRRLCSLILVISVLGLVITGVFVVAYNGRETVRPVETLNPAGLTGTVFVVFRPGVTSFNEDVVNAFIRGLVDSDWRVNVTTTSTQTPTNVTGYDLIILGSPTNGGQPHAAMLAYLERVDFEGKPVVLILTSGGNGIPSIHVFGNATVAADGVIHGEYRYQLWATGAIDAAYTAGTEITL
jgi:hypothetical protein